MASLRNLTNRTKTISRDALMVKDRISFRREFYQRAYLSYPPRHVTIAIASACMFRCVFCAYHADDARDGASNVYGLRYSLSLEEFKRMVDMCYEGRVPNVHICATGEPFLHKDILPMIDYLIEVYGFASIQTDLFAPIFKKHNYLDAIVARGDLITKITTDILSGDPKTHEELKRGSSYEDVLSSMEYISRHSSVHFEVHYIITRLNYEHIDLLIEDLARRRINCHVAIVNLHAHGFNEFTSPYAVYTSKDIHMTKALHQAEALGRAKGIPVYLPSPADIGSGVCGSFWSRLQTWPVKGIDKDRFADNVIVGGCNAVVIGNLKSLGYFFDYKNIMELWNNEHFAQIRQNLIKGIYPDEACRFCQNYKGEVRWEEMPYWLKQANEVEV